MLLLLLAIASPAGLLYLRLVLEQISSQGQLARTQVTWLTWASNGTLALFFVAQLICARYVQRLLKPSITFFGSALQYSAVLLLCLLFSVCGAVLLEAFGYYFFLRVRSAMPQ